MAYDATVRVDVLFGGNDEGYLADTWTWNGTDWSLGIAESIRLHPRSGPPGAVVMIRGWGFAAGERVRLTFVDSTQGRIFLQEVSTYQTGEFATQITIPLAANPGRQRVKARGLTSGEIAKRGFTVT